MIRAISLVCSLPIVAACASVGPTADQMKAMEGVSASLCVESPGWNGAAVKVHYASFGGHSVGTAGGNGEVTCGSSTVKFTNEGKAGQLVKQPDTQPTKGTQ